MLPIKLRDVQIRANLACIRLHLFERFALFVRKFDYTVIEPLYGYTSLRVMEGAKELAHSVNRVLYRTAEKTRMQIAIRTIDCNFESS
ncbi:hypothetical protein D3C85_1689380 [compost metagenome]